MASLPLKINAFGHLCSDGTICLKTDGMLALLNLRDGPDGPPTASPMAALEPLSAAQSPGIFSTSRAAKATLLK